MNKRTKAGKEEFEEFTKQAGSKTVISKADYELAKACADSVLSHDEAKFLLSDGVAEASFFSEIDGINVKCRPDYYNKRHGIIIDVKSCNDASPDAFVKDVAKFGYYIQDPFYCDVLESLGYPANKFIFIAVEKKAPHMVGIYELDVVAKDFGRDEYNRAFGIYRERSKFDSTLYRDTVDGSVIQTLTLPNYVYYKKGA